MGLRLGDGPKSDAPAPVLPLRSERRARDERDQRARGQFYERTYRTALADVRAIVATTHGADALAALEEIDGIAKRAMEARW